MIASIVTILAPTVSCIQTVPQLYKVYITKHVEDLSFSTLVLLVVSTSLWALHGFFIRDGSLLAAGIISVVVNIALVILYLIYRKVDLVETRV